MPDVIAVANVKGKRKLEKLSWGNGLSWQFFIIQIQTTEWIKDL